MSCQQHQNQDAFCKTFCGGCFLRYRCRSRWCDLISLSFFLRSKLSSTMGCRCLHCQCFIGDGCMNNLSRLNGPSVTSDGQSQNGRMPARRLHWCWELWSLVVIKWPTAVSVSMTSASQLHGIEWTEHFFLTREFNATGKRTNFQRKHSSDRSIKCLSRRTGSC